MRYLRGKGGGAGGGIHDHVWPPFQDQRPQSAREERGRMESTSKLPLMSLRVTHTGVIARGGGGEGGYGHICKDAGYTMGR